MVYPGSSQPLSVAPHRMQVHTLPLGDPTGGADARVWREQVDGALHHPKVHIDRSVFITMSDGVTLSATVVRPADRHGRPVEQSYPAIVNINPYNRALIDLVDQAANAPALGRAFRATAGHAMLDVFGVNRRLVRSGYTQVIVDVRGTGASHGRWQILGAREQDDSVEVIEWAASQPWCSGSVGLAGWSYSAINSLQAADKRPAALKAVFAVEGCSDIVRDIYITGGMPSLFIPMWLSIINGLKWIPHPSTAFKDLQSGHLRGWLRDRLYSPATEMGSLAWGFLTGRDDRIYDDPYFDERDPQVGEIEVPTFLVGAWHDLFGRSATKIYNDLRVRPGRKQLLVADGYHLDAGRGFGGSVTPPRLDVLERAWFDKWLKDIDNGVNEYGPVTLQQQGGCWTSGAQFPRMGTHTERLFLSETTSATNPDARFDGSLDKLGPLAHTRVDIHPDLRGMVSRDMTQVTAGFTKMFGALFTTDASFQERGGLTFTSAPVAEPMQISGAMNLRLYVCTDAHEGIWAVTVNDVAPNGISTVLTNGALSMSNRAIDPLRSEYDEQGNLLMAHHHLSLAHKLPVPEDIPVALDVDLVPTDALLDTGHRLRVDIYAASFPRYLTTVPDLIKARSRQQHLVLDPKRRSHLTLRMLGTPGW